MEKSCQQAHGCNYNLFSLESAPLIVAYFMSVGAET